MGLEVVLQKKFKGFSLDISWKIQNELVVVFGGSGSGKTMTLQMLAGLITPDSGFIDLDGEIYFDSSAKVNLRPQKRSFGYVFQDLAIFPHMTVLQNILYGASGLQKPEALEEASKMMSHFQLAGLESRYPNEISGGQKQRVAFARALIRRPKALLLDEPFSALDRSLRLEMRRFLLKIKNDFDIPIVLVTHAIEEALIANKMIVYEQGRIVQMDTPENIRSNPVSQYVADLTL